MLPAFLIALREGVEAALVVGIILVYLSRTGRSHLARFAWFGLAAASALSLAVAIGLQHWRISEDGFEGLMYLLAAFFVVTMIVWMNRVARHLKKEIEQKVELYASRGGSAAGWGIFLFVFLMVLREGVELALILRAVEMSTEGLQTWIGTLAGIAAAIAVGVFFFKGTLRVPLHRFFAVTTVILMIVAFQLALTGLHELSEARWLPSGKQEMALIGPIVRNEVFFFVVIFGAATLLILREWQSASRAEAAQDGVNDAERRLRESQNRRAKSWMMAASVACLAVILVLSADFAYTRANSAPPAAQALSRRSETKCACRLSEVQDSNMHLYTVEIGGQTSALHGHQETQWLWHRARCLPHLRGRGISAGRTERGLPSLRFGDIHSVDWRTGGCNPVGVASHIDGTDIVMDLTSLTKAASEVPK